MTTVMDPTSEVRRQMRARASRLESLAGVTVGLLDISKARGNVFLDQLAVGLEQRSIDVRRYMKPTFAKPAPADLRYRIREQCGAVIEALAD